MAVEFTKADGIGYITLNRPPANSYDAAFVDELAQAVDQAATDDGVHVVIVRSALEKFFSAGADVKAFSQNPPERNMDMVRAAHRTLGRIATIPKIFIAQIQG